MPMQNVFWISVKKWVSNQEVMTHDRWISNLQWNWKILKSLWPSKQGKWIGRNKRIFEREKISTLFHFEFLVDNVPEEPPSLQCCLLSRFLSWNGLGTSTPPPSSEEKIFTNTHTHTHSHTIHTCCYCTYANIQKCWHPKSLKITTIGVSKNIGLSIVQRRWRKVLVVFVSNFKSLRGIILLKLSHQWIGWLLSLKQSYRGHLLTCLVPSYSK